MEPSLLRCMYGMTWQGTHRPEAVAEPECGHATVGVFENAAKAGGHVVEEQDLGVCSDEDRWPAVLEP